MQALNSAATEPLNALSRSLLLQSDTNEVNSCSTRNAVESQPGIAFIYTRRAPDGEQLPHPATSRSSLCVRQLQLGM